MNKTIISILSITLSTFFCSAKTQKVLFIGNSITYYNNMPQVFRDIANEKGDSVTLTVYAPGGTGFQNHSVDNNVFDHFREGGWDVIILQPGSNESVGVPPTQSRATTLSQARILIDSAMLYNPCSRILFYEISYGVWGTSSADVAQYNNTMNDIKATNTYLSDSTGLPFVPAGETLRYVWNQNPSDLLWGSAGDIHPNIKGSYLISCAFYSAVFFKPSAGSPVNNGNTITDAAYYQHISDSVVLLHLNNWRIDTLWHKANFQYNINGLSVSFNGTAQNADSVRWWMDGIEYTTFNPNHTFAASGNQQVKMVAYFGSCPDTIVKEINVSSSTFIENNSTQMPVNIYPSPVSGILHIQMPKEVRNYTVSVINLFGKVVLMEKNKNKLDMSSLSHGIYVVKTEDLDRRIVVVAKIIKQ